ncbi:MAG: hypothetical protein KAS97_04950 [Candidatus Aminicenantes bacterium]|nr:hypothetical protein [Candidatus Aminicenantes bacterium]
MKLWEKLKKNRIRYLAFDYYMNPIDRPFEGVIKKMLDMYKKREDLFKVKKHLFYKGRVIAIIMEAKY